MSNKWEKVDKILSAVNYFSEGKGRSIKQIQAHFEISRKSVYRLFETLESLGIPLVDEKVEGEREKYWRISDSYSSNNLVHLSNINLPTQSFTVTDAILLQSLIGSSKTYKSESLDKNVEMFKNKVFKAAKISEQTQEYMDRLSKMYVSVEKATKDYSAKEDIIDELASNILGRKVCKIAYISFKSKSVKNHLLLPMHFFEHKNGLYMLAYKMSSQSVITLAVDRITEILDYNQTMEVKYPENFSAEDFLQNGFDIFNLPDEKIELEFSSNVSMLIKERIYSNNQQIIEKEDGSLIFKMETGVSPELISWVLGYGKEVKVISSENLKVKIREEVEALSGIYL